MTTSSNNLVSNNNIHDNGNIGIGLGSSDSSVYNNTLHNNYIGINLESTGCNVWDNDIQSSLLYGIQTKSSTSSNVIYNNSFKSNLGPYHAIEQGSNNWDNGTVGNYWDDFYGPDPSNSSCKLPLSSDVYHYTRGGVIDNFPKGIFNLIPVVSNPSPGNLEGEVAKQPTLTVDVVDPDPLHYKERLDVSFYYVGIDGSINYIGSHQNVESGGTASKWFSSLNDGGNPAYSYKGLGYDYIGIWFVEVEDQYYKTTTFSDQWIFSTINTPVNNQKPIVEIDVTENVQLGDEIIFDGSGCNDTDGEIIFYRWSFGDDTNVINEISPTHSYQSTGVYKASLVVIDNHGSSNIKNVSITVTNNTNRPPVAKINGPYNGIVGKSITFSSTGSNDPDSGDSISYTWSFGDGTTSTEENPTHKYSNVGNYTVTLAVEDQSVITDPITTYALIKSSNDSGESPGFEIIFVLIALMLILFVKKKHKK